MGLSPGGIRAEGPTPEESLARMQVASGFQVDLVACEPLVQQPVAIEFDDRNRLWVIQYLQYPNPEGLQRVQVDRYSRTKYDRVPEPPPHGPRGADRITILEDSDGDGRMDRGKDFVSGLNLATGMAFGHGGLFVLNVPYLLFYPDRNRDDVPDSDPEVLLSGFGMEDAHSVANSLTWGPDGWLYGCQGSTVTANIRGIEFQQGVWRYHPLTHAFELFCEGGGNCWGLDFDARGNLFYSTNYGGYILVHGVPGAYYTKSFAKHGGLHNRFAYGYFEHAAHENFRGGHVTVGGIVYQERAFPAEFRGKVIAGDLLGHAVYWHHVQPSGSTFTTAHAGQLLTSLDNWFAPTDVAVGPDGAIYVSDWCDGRTAHPDPDAPWDRSNGRVYRIAATGNGFPKAADLAPVPESELVNVIIDDSRQSQWHVRRARQELVRRLGDSELTVDSRSRLRDVARHSSDEQPALESLWTILSLGGFDEALAFDLLDSPHAAVRAWTVRALGDKRSLSEPMAHRLDELAETEPSLEVRVQLACAAQRFSAGQALPIINANINRDIDTSDQRMPLLWWWAVEKHSVSGREEVLKRFVRPSLWNSTLGRDHLLPKLIRRYAAEGSTEGIASVVQLLQAAPMGQRLALWSQILQGLEERESGSSNVDDIQFKQLALAAWQASPADLTLLKLAMVLGDPSAMEAARREAFSTSGAASRRAALLDILAAVSAPGLIDDAVRVVQTDPNEEVQRAALRLLSRYDDPGVARALVQLHQLLKSSSLQSQMREILLSRRSSAVEWLSAVDRGEIPATITPLDQIRRVALLNDEKLSALVAKHWGKLKSTTPEEKLAEVRRLNNDLRAAPGNAEAGELLFKQHCAACHQLFGQGTKLGPDLSSANRHDRDFLLVSLVDPSSVIRKEYVSVVIQTKDGRVLTGLPVSRAGAEITLLDAKSQPLTVATAEIERQIDSPISLMPDNLYRQLSPQQLRDLFAYLQRKE